MPAVCRVLKGASVSQELVLKNKQAHEINPQIMADPAYFAMVFACDGARAVRTPIWIPNELRFAKPQSEYEAIVYARGESGLELAWMA